MLLINSLAVQGLEFFVTNCMVYVYIHFTVIVNNILIELCDLLFLSYSLLLKNFQLKTVRAVIAVLLKITILWDMMPLLSI
jgi:hypothetical protein